jgi:hypothetical protein
MASGNFNKSGGKQTAFLNVVANLLAALTVTFFNFITAFSTAVFLIFPFVIKETMQ